MAAAAAIGAFGQVRAGQAANAQGQYEQAVQNQNALMDDRARRDAIIAGNFQQTQHFRQLAQTMSNARVASAAAGIDANFGSAASVSDDVALMGYEDAGTLARNTNQQVLGYDIQASNARSSGAAAAMRGQAALQAGYIGAAGSILSGASQIGKMQAGMNMPGSAPLPDLRTLGS